MRELATDSSLNLPSLQAKEMEVAVATVVALDSLEAPNPEPQLFSAQCDS